MSCFQTIHRFSNFPPSWHICKAMLQTYPVDIELCRTYLFAMERLCIYYRNFELTEKCACGCLILSEICTNSDIRTKNNWYDQWRADAQGYNKDSTVCENFVVNVLPVIRCRCAKELKCWSCHDASYNNIQQCHKVSIWDQLNASPSSESAKLTGLSGIGWFMRCSLIT